MAQFPAVIDLSSLDGTTGFRIAGAAAYDNSGRSVSSAGDVNGDGFDDVIVGANRAHPNGNLSGASYVVFGKAGGFSSSLDLSSLDGTTGFKLSGEAAGDLSGFSVAGAGDVNGDGFADVIVGAYGADPNASYSGASYVVFGHAGGFAPSLALSSLDGTTGFRIDGEADNDRSGQSVSSAGDVNGDGFDDIIVGARYADPNGSKSGASYVVFGHAGGFSASLDLSSLDGTTGFRIAGAVAGDQSGISVAGAGDVNGDGFDDIIVGALGADANGDFSGASFVVFGKAGGFSASLDLSSLDGTTGFRIDGAAGYDFSGRSVSSAGDVNGDGFDDLLVGAYNADANSGYSGASYVVFGKAGGFASSLDLSSLDGTTGFKLTGEAAYDYSGFSVSNAGDVNGDGFADILVGVAGADANGNNSGASYVVFGHAGGFASSLALSSLGGTTGFRIDGAAANDGSGRSVSSAGDVNGDGFADLIVGASGADANGDDSGASYVVYGRAPDAAVTRTGTAAGDVLAGGAGADTLDGAGGDDRLRGSGGDDWLIGGAGTDTALFSGNAADYRVTLVSGPKSTAYTVADLRAGSPDGTDTLTGIETLQFADSARPVVAAVFPATLPLSGLDGTTGFRIDGEAAGDLSGFSVSDAGDVNGDGFDDIVVGAQFADPNGTYSGASYVVFGKASGFDATLALSSLDGTTGFRIAGAAVGDISGHSVSGAGDVNGDGFDDLIVGADRADPNGDQSGASYVVFGKASGFDATLALSSLDGTTGFRIAGEATYDRSGFSVSDAGDVNGDGFDDLILGANRADPNGNYSGASYVVFGKAGGFSASLALSSLDGTTGFRIDGAADFDFSGYSVSSAGDVNGDGFDDVIVGAIGADANGGNSGASYVVFGKASGFTANLDLSSLDGTTGFRIAGAAVDDYSGFSVSGAGDVNGDGFADVIVGANRADPNGSYSGASYVVFGHAGGFSSSLDLSSLDGTTGFRIAGEAGFDFSGFSVSSAGDVNGDGFDDVIVGAYRADPNGDKSGASYVVFGKAGGFASSLALSSLDGATGFKLAGTAADDRSGVSVSSAGDVNGDGFDDLIVGAPGADQTGASYVVYGRAPDLAVIRTGTPAGDVLAGGAYADTLDGAGGDDRLHGNGGSDRLIGGAGSDTAFFAGNAADYRVTLVTGPAGTAYTVADLRPGSPDGTDTLTGVETVRFADGARALAAFPATLPLSSLDGTTGFRLDGEATYDNSGRSVSSAGDVNGDGFADLLVGSPFADSNGNNSGASYVVFGKASGFSSSLALSSLDGTTGFKLSGEAAYDFSGYSVSSAGDVNGDGFADIIVGAYGADANGRNSGASYVVFGHAGGFAPSLALSSLDGNTGFRIAGAVAGDQFGFSVSSAGDVNGDGFADIVVGAYRADTGGYNSGSSYVVFGKVGGFASSLALSSLDGTTGFRIDGAADFDFSGRSVSSAGDVNGDGFDDVIVGAYGANANGGFSGASYVVFGKAGGFAPSVALSSLDGTTGFRIAGAAAYDNSGFSVSSAGDVNGDGFDDLIVGARYADANGIDSGASYVVFGKAGGFSSSLDLSSLDGTTGFKLGGEGTDDNSGQSMSSAGDVNGDGFADIIVGASGADANGNFSGASYVVFGHAGGFSASLDLSSLDGATGFKLTGVDTNDYSGRSVSSAGDVNGDGFADLVIGANAANPNGGNTGASYVVYGRAPDAAVIRTGTAADQTLAGGAFADTIDGAGGDDRLHGNGGSDILIGGAGTDTALFSGNAADYRVTLVSGPAGTSYTVADLRPGSPDGTDTLTGIETLQFADGARALAAFPATLPLSGLDGTTGFRIDGEATYDNSGRSVSSAGDVNGDGFADIIVGAPYASPNGNLSGSSFVVFGKAGGFSASLDLSSLDGTTGFKLSGAATFDQSGFSVAGAGDVNGDGFDDVIVGANGADSNGRLFGSSYVVFGKEGGFAASLDLSSLDGTTGFRIDSAAAYDQSGRSVSSAGDVNGDGFDDLLVGAPFADPNGNLSGSSFVVFGKAGGFSSSLDLSSLDGTTGFRIDGAAGLDQSGISVAGAGDVNGDGFDDVIVGALGADLNGNFSGSSYVVFGHAGGFAPSLALSSLALSSLGGTTGFRIDGAAANDGSGRSVSSAGDVNGDGFADLIVGASGADANGIDSGASYVVFGKAGGFSASLGLSSLDGTTGFRIAGAAANDYSGYSVSSAGDVNGDGFADILVGSPFADANGNSSGSSYVVFGHAGGFAPSLALSSLDGATGFRVTGEATSDYSGRSVSGAGDVNGDGFADLIVGADRADVNGTNSGASYVVYGRAPDLAVIRTGTAAGDVLAGGAYADTLDGAGGDDRLYGNGGDDLLDGGTGRDAMRGGLGDDTYLVDDAGDGVFEAVGEGTDTVIASVSYALGAGQEVETLRLDASTGTTAYTLTGNAFANTLIGNAGANVLAGGAGNDTLDGGAGTDILQGGLGDDTYRVDDGGDGVIEAAGEGTDTVIASVSYALGAGQEVETLRLAASTGTAALDLTGNAFANTLIGNDGANGLDGGAGNDTLDGGAGADTLQGGLGDDTYLVDDAGDGVIEAADGGSDTVIASVSYQLGAGQEVETLQLAASTGTTAYSLAGNEFANTLIGNDGNNLLNGGGGADTLQGGLGDDTYLVDDAGDGVFEAAGEGTDTVIASVSYALGAGQAVETLRLDASTGTTAYTLTGNELANTLIGNAGANTLDGGAGADILRGGAGNDTYLVDNAADQVIEAANGGSDTVIATTSYALAADQSVETLQLAASTGTTAYNLTGNAFANTLIGNGGNNLLKGGAGADVLRGGLGNDTYEVDDAGDQVIEAANGGTDTVIATTSYALAAGQEVETLQFSSATGTTAYNLTGNAFANTLIGNGGANILDGGAGADILRGGAGNDTYLVDNAADQVIEAANGGTDTVIATTSYALAADQSVETLQLAASTGTTAYNLTGNAFANTLIGNGGNNLLKGGEGADILKGGLGNDTYEVDNAGDQVIEAANGGTDTVIATTSYALAAGQEVETLQFSSATGTTAYNLTGNAFANTLIGNGGNNLLKGGMGADVLRGGLGNDTYEVDDAGDQVIEAANGGTDTVIATTSYALAAGQEVETLQFSSATGTTAYNLTGNAFANTLIGNGGANILDGGAGADILRGGAGNDTYLVDNAADQVIEAANGGSDTVIATTSYALAADQSVETLQLAASTGTTAYTLTGNAFANTLIGNGGNNLLKGGAGADVLRGGLGNDTYEVDDAGDQVIEAANGGTDTVIATTSYALAAGQEVETLQFSSATGTTAYNLTGNAFANTLIGNGGANILDGGAGADILRGGAGNDTYLVDNAADQVIEAANGGTDTVIATTSYALAADQSVETLQLAASTGTTAYNLTGNAFANTLIGNGGNNLLKGGAGADVLRGGLGNDTYEVDDAGDQVIEAANGGTDTVIATTSYALAAGQEVETLQFSSATGTTAYNLTGNAFANTLIGNGGANILDGGAGADILRGGAGADTFVFNTALVSGSADRITDFVVSTAAVHDTLQLARTIFAALAPGDLAEAAFKDLGLTGATVDADDRILYDRGTGSLSYDADGSGASTAVQFAVFDNKALLTHHDFIIA